MRCCEAAQPAVCSIVLSSRTILPTILQSTCCESNRRMSSESSSPDLATAQAKAKEILDQHTYENVQWHFHESTGSPFWLEKKKELKFDPLKEVKNFDDLKKFPIFEDDWLRGGRFVDGCPRIGWKTDLRLRDRWDNWCSEEPCRHR